METSPEQLSLPLFESNPDRQPSRAHRRVARKAKPKRSVAPSHTLSSTVVNRAAASSPSSSLALLTTSEAAEALRVHPRTVQRLVERGQLDAIHLGAAVRFDPQDVAELTARLKRSAQQTADASVDVLRQSRPVRISFSDRLRSRA
jgi:excisionase family DNA binding protein